MSVLVKPIDKHEEIQIILKRRLEWIVLFSIKEESINCLKELGLWTSKEQQEYADLLVIR